MPTEKERQELKGIFTPTNTQLLAGYCRNSVVNSSACRTDFDKKEKDEPTRWSKRPIQKKGCKQRKIVNNTP